MSPVVAPVLSHPDWQFPLGDLQEDSPKAQKASKKRSGAFLAELTTVLHAWFYPLESMYDAFVNRQSNAAAAQNSWSGCITATLEQGLVFAF